ncbi:type II secretion system protein GspL [Curvibacter sp. HBC61]|uniref:Type II secretion system protein GspL n=1 Tax=Curvibacter cyanobacteriorum TaxID=3026422 RepID=A0ABT5MYC7_9BURK|nr:type II secretion system protein GspL [Curvibacter sp. HBC61]MDD0839067.1 type II secretion system protein GspL [Curvibacter sp. HBC61]
MSTLIVHLPALSPTASTEWPYLLTPDGQTVAQQGSAVASLLPPVPRPAEVVAVVPVQHLSWQAVVLPRGTQAGSPRLQAVLEGLLEERLLDEPQHLHLALGPSSDAGADAPRWVAVCDRAWLRDCVQALEAAGRPVTRIVPELWPAAATDSAVVRALAAPPDSDRPAFWAGTGLGPQRPVECLPLQPATPHPAPHDSTEWLAEPAVAALAERCLGRPVRLETPASRWLAAAASPWELAQHSFASGQRQRLGRHLVRQLQSAWQAPAWRPARWGVAALLLAQLAGLNAWAWKENQTLRQRAADIRQTLTSTFPQVQVVVDAPLQMAREVSALRQASGQAAGDDLESLLGAAALAAPPGRIPSGIEFAAGELRLKGLSLNPEEGQATLDRLRQRGYSGRLEADQLTLRQEPR